MPSAIRLARLGARAALPLCLLTPATFAQDVCRPFPALVFDGGPSPAAVEAGDIDGDGDLDLVVGDACATQVRVLFNDGDGAFERFADVSLYDPVVGIALGDLDGDQDLDVVAIEVYATKHVVVLENQAGVLSVAQRFEAPILGGHPELGDLDGDGDPDLVLTTIVSTSPAVRALAVWPNPGTGVFGAPVLYPMLPGEFPLEPELGDWDGDGDLDVSTTGQLGLIATWLNPGNGLLVRAPDLTLLGNSRMVAADIDLDGLDDRVVARRVAQEVVVLLSKGGTITLPPFQAQPVALRAADLDGNGTTDLRVLAGGVHDFLVQRGGAIVPAAMRPVPELSDALAVADLDGDLVPDTAVANYAADSIAMHLTSGAHSYVAGESLDIGEGSDAEFVDLDEDGDLDVVRAGWADTKVYLRHEGQLFPSGLILPPAQHVRAAQLIAGGAPELVLFSANDTTVRVFAGSAVFGYGEVEASFAGVYAFSLAAGDVNGDGHVDLVFGSAPQVGTVAPVSIVLGHGDGTLEAPSVFFWPRSPIQVGLADLDGDADLDLVAATRSPFDYPVWAFENAGGGIFATPVAIAGPFGGTFALGDVDLDGDVDVVAASNGTKTARVLANDGLGAFTPAASLPVGREILQLELARIDGDGALDLVTNETSSPMHWPGMLLGVWTNRLGGTFEPQSLHSVGPMREEFRVADWTGDGRNDLLVLEESAPTGGGAWVLANAGGCATGSSLCSGDGTASPCPCGNAGAAGHGCASSFDTAGAELAGEGDASVQADTLALVARGLPPTTVVHFLQSGSAENGGAGTPFGDGLLCVGGTIRRLAVRQASGGVARLGAGDGSTATMSGLGQLPPAGGVRIYQARYRNSASFCTPATFNTTNAVAIAWGG